MAAGESQAPQPHPRGEGKELQNHRAREKRGRGFPLSVSLPRWQPVHGPGKSPQRRAGTTLRALLGSVTTVNSRRHRCSECKLIRKYVCIRGPGLPANKFTIRIQLLSRPKYLGHGQPSESLAAAPADFPCQSPLPVITKWRSIISPWRECRTCVQS